MHSIYKLQSIKSQLLAVVYGSYEEEEKKKFKRVFRHKMFVYTMFDYCIRYLLYTVLNYRRALDKAYDLLATDQGLCFRDFLMFMHYYQPMTREIKATCNIGTSWRYWLNCSRVAKWQVMCIFKALCKDPQQQQQYLSREEFFNLHDVRGLKWKQVASTVTMNWEQICKCNDCMYAESYTALLEASMGSVHP